MSAVAKLLHDSGVVVTGSDEGVYPPVSDFLKDLGIPYQTSYAAGNLPRDADLIVIGKNAKLVPETNPEVAAAYASGIRIMSFPEVLSEISSAKDTIVVAGAFGKSTSTALFAHCLESLPASSAGYDSSWFIGAIPLTPSTNARMGKGKLFVLEGDEYPSSNTDPRSKFLHYHPRHLLITPIAHDHVNIFPTPADYVAPFIELTKLVPADGSIVMCLEGPLSADVLTRIARPVVTYGVHRGEYHAADIVWGERTRFTLMRGAEKIVSLETNQLGEHNIQNIVGVAAFLLTHNIATPEQIATAIASFRGIRRRLDRKSEKTRLPIFEGFGSSYDKARSAIAAMKQHFPTRRLVVVFEPHTFSWRNRSTLHWYDDAFAGAAKVFVWKPAEQGAGTHDQIGQAEILGRLAGGGFDAEGVGEAGVAVERIGTALGEDCAVLFLTSGPLGGLIESVPAWAEKHFPA